MLTLERNTTTNLGSTFIAIREIQDIDIRTALDRYEAHWHATVLKRFCTPRAPDELPPLFATTNSRFSYIKRDVLIDALGTHRSTPTDQIIGMLQKLIQGEHYASKILGDTPDSVSSALTSGALRSVHFDNLRERFVHCRTKLPTYSAHDFVGFLTDFEQVQARGLAISSAYTVLLALYAAGVLLHPFGMWRGLYPGSGVASSQRFLEGQFTANVLTADQLCTLRTFSDATRETLSHRSQLLRCISCLLPTSHIPLYQRDPDEILMCANNYLLDDAFRARPGGVRTDTRTHLNNVLRILADIMTAQGVVSAARLTRPKALVDGHRARKYGGTRGDGTFRFLSASGLDKWAALLSEYVNVAPVSKKKSVVSPLLPFTDWLTKHCANATSPELITRADVVRIATTTRSKTLLEFLGERYPNISAAPSTTFGQSRLLLEWYRREKNNEYIVPMLVDDQPSAPEYAGKTNKEALPARVIELMKTILSEDSFAWPRRFSADYVKFTDPTTRRKDSVWCPVRAVALYTLLWIPLRAIQVRLLDSGEFDEHIYSHEKRTFLPNPNGLKDRRLGVFREFQDPRGTSGRYIGLFVNTNKTSRIFTGGNHQGYNIQWERPEILGALTMVREWQSTYNSLPAPVHVNSLEDHTLHSPNHVMNLIPPYAFLFRDPATNRASPWEPISYHRISSMFLELCAEAERRLQSDGIPIQLIDAWGTKADGTSKPTSCRVTLHGLRVSGITNFAEFGCPINVLTEFLAGHSTILMNLWYQKFGFCSVSSIIDRASGAVLTAAGLRQMQRWVDEKAEDGFADLANQESGREFSDDLEYPVFGGSLIGGSLDGLRSLREQSVGIWHIGIDGLCPNGRTGCHEGGPRIGTKGWTRSTPVRGGDGNCPECRFWVTGPQFIFGQIVKANVLLYHIRESGQALENLQDQLDDLQQSTNTGTDAEHRAAELRASIEVYEKQIENALQTWVKRYEFAARSMALLRSDGADSGSAHRLLTSTGELEVARDRGPPPGRDQQQDDPDSEDLPSIALMESHPLELMEFATQACEFVPGVDVPSARLLKGKLLDMMLDREGRNPLFFKLSEQDALRAGNALTRFLTAVVGEKGVSELLSGESTLAALGLTNEFDAALQDSVESATSPNPRFVRSDGSTGDLEVRRATRMT